MINVNSTSKLYYQEKTRIHYASPPPKCHNCKQTIELIAYCITRTQNARTADRVYFCEKCVRAHHNKEKTLIRDKISQITEIGRCLIVESPELLPDNCIFIPIMPASVSNTNVSLAYAASPKYDQERGGPPPKIIDHTKLSGRKQHEELAENNTKTLLERQDTPANAGEMARILTSKPIKETENQLTRKEV